MKDFYFMINEDDMFELWVNGECITDCFSLVDGEADLMKQLVEFANVPCYNKCDIIKEIKKIEKKVLTNPCKYAIMIIEKQKEEIKMRALTYTMADGTEVKTLAEAKAGGKYTAKLTEIPEPTHTAPTQIADVAIVFGIEN